MNNINDDKLQDLIKNYNEDKELNRLKDILEYLKNYPVYLPTTIKISKQKLFKIPNDDLIMILDDLTNKLNSKYFPVYSSIQKINSKYQYALPVMITDCILLMKRFKEKQEIIINPDLASCLIIDTMLIKYLKNKN